MQFNKQSLNLENGLSFVLLRDDNGEQIQINSLAVNVIPEPTTLALISLALAGIGYGRKRKAA